MKVNGYNIASYEEWAAWQKAHNLSATRKGYADMLKLVEAYTR